MVRDGATAEDLAQDVFSRAFTALQSYRGDATSRSWLLTIARNRCIDHLRARQREGWRDSWEDESGPDMQPDRKKLPSDLLALRDEVEQALAALTENERALIVLRFRHGLDYRELATVFGQRMGTLRMRLSRTLNRMRELLERAEQLGPERVSAPRAMEPRRTVRQRRVKRPEQLGAQSPSRGDRRPPPPAPSRGARRPPQPAPGGPPPKRAPSAPPAAMPRGYSPAAGSSAPGGTGRGRYQQLEQLLEAIDAGVSRELLRRLYGAADEL
jgi:RNA polymerase sigma-70 factor (ECF subfamily)